MTVKQYISIHVPRVEDDKSLLCLIAEVAKISIHVPRVEDDSRII